MKKSAVLFGVVGLVAAHAYAASTINPVNRHAHGANIGWMDARADVTNGVVIGQYVCSGYIYAANVGWIHLGNGSPVNGVEYQNNSGADYGINHDGTGNLRGYGYGSNIGWVNFESNGDPSVDLSSGALSGYIWGANVGWISLSNAYAIVQTDILAAGADSDNDGIVDAWEYGYTNTLAVLTDGGTDSDGDGVPDVHEYGADTDPFDAGDYLAIIDFQVDVATNWVTWPVKATRVYTLLHGTELSTGAVWTTTGSPFRPPADTDVQQAVTGVTDTKRYYWVEAAMPLGF
ncbi:MAG: hypothetical protein K9N51_12375 [Candidatus Pacebacteria bacterium]|nr:hypothetical protein [Candidatus Paceibacterota bacterium]